MDDDVASRKSMGGAVTLPGFELVIAVTVLTRFAPSPSQCGRSRSRPASSGRRACTRLRGDTGWFRLSRHKVAKPPNSNRIAAAPGCIVRTRAALEARKLRVVSAHPVHKSDGTGTQIDDGLLVGRAKYFPGLKIGFILQPIELQVLRVRPYCLGQLQKIQRKELCRPSEIQHDIGVGSGSRSPSDPNQPAWRCCSCLPDKSRSPPAATA